MIITRFLLGILLASLVAQSIMGFGRIEGCLQLPDDPFEIGAYINFGKHHDKCYDSIEKRPVKLISHTPSIEEGERIWVANFHHRNKYYAASIPFVHIQEAQMQIESFPSQVPAAHTQLRLKMSPEHPIRLYSQRSWSPANTEEVLYELYDVILSVEAGGPKGFAYDIFRGTEDEFVLVLRLKSLWQSADWMIVQQNHEVKQLVLNLGSEQLGRMMKYYAEKGDSMGIQYPYHTLTKNCGNELLKFIDEVSSYSWPRRLLIRANPMLDAYPVMMKESLIMRGVLSHETQNLETEWPSHAENY